MGHTGHGKSSKQAAARASIALSALALLCLAFAPSALAAPSHPRLEALDISGLNHACGAAVDSKGDVYASSAGESKVKVFNAAHAEIGSIANANEPCALAVDSKGNLYVSEAKTGNVVKYHPTAYPFAGAPSYEAPATVDASGNAKGIAVDPTDDSLYVAEGTRVATFSSAGTPGINEQQRMRASCPSGETFTLTFEAQTTASIPCEASHEEVQAALVALSTIGAGNVSVTQDPSEPANPQNHRVTFTSALGGTDVPELTGSVGCCFIATTTQGFSGHIGEGELSGATGVAAYTYGSNQHYLSAAEPAAGEIQILAGTELGALEPRAAIDGKETPEGTLGLAPSGAYLGVDPKNGHLFAYDATHKVLNEFEATGQYFTRVVSAAFTDAQATAVAVDRSGGANTGTLYASAGAGAGARLLAFGPVAAPSRLALPEPPTEKFTAACGTAVDSAGDAYIAGEAAIKVYAAEPQLKEGKPVPLATIPDSGHPCDLAVDSQGNLYAAERGKLGSEGDESVARLEPSAYPPVSGTTYTKNPTPVETIEQPRGIAVNPANGHLFVVHVGDPTHGGVHEYDSAAHGSTPLKSSFCGLGDQNPGGIDVYGANGDAYVVESKQISVCNSTGTRVVARIDGSGSPGGAFGGLNGARVAVDQSNGHVMVGEMESRGVVEEFDASGAFVAQFGPFSKVSQVPSDIAVDNSSGPTSGNLYVAYLNKLTAFGPLAYGEPPVAVTGTASEIGGGEATLNGSVDPRGFELSACRFEYLTDAQYVANGETFAGATVEACDKTLAEIGKGTGAVAVHANVTGLDPEGRYRFRLVAANKFGASEGEPALFGVPVITTKTAQPILYHEATLRGKIDPSGLATEYHFEYGFEEGEYDQSTSTRTLSASVGKSNVEVPLADLAEGTTYHFRLVAENEAASVEGPDQELTTQARHPALECPNATLRLENNSSNLPDCRAYELVTQADTRGSAPRGTENVGPRFNEWLVTPYGPLAGESLAFFLPTTFPGTEGSGLWNGFRATRGMDGWGSDLFGPSFAQNGDQADVPEGVASDQLYSLWSLGSDGSPGAFARGTYLGTPEGFEPLAIGSLGTDLGAAGKYVSPGGAHVIFASTAQLEPDAPVSPLAAIYDRSPGGSTHVVSLLPGEVTPTSSATYAGATPDGSSVVFTLNGNLYLRRNDAETLKVAGAPASFAGISEDGERIFYTGSSDPKALSGLYAFDVEGEATTQIAPSARFIDVSADGSHAYFTTGSNLYMWDGSGTALVATLDPRDLSQSAPPRFPGTAAYPNIALDSWSAECVVKRDPEDGTGRAACPSRTTPDGRFLVFQSHADLTPPYEGEGHSEVYRYDAGDGSILCVSCDPSGAPATAEADLQTTPPINAAILIPGVTDDGSEVFFTTEAALLPEDANSVRDVYEWQAEGTGGCERFGGCLALISSGQGDNPSYIYSMTPDGHDVFFSTAERLVGSDIAGSPSIYDARVGGGFSAEVEGEPCHGDACQGEGSPEPELPAVRSDAPGSGNVEEPPLTRKPCTRGKHRVKGRCAAVRKHHHKRQHRRAKRNRRAGR